MSASEILDVDLLAFERGTSRLAAYSGGDPSAGPQATSTDDGSGRGGPGGTMGQAPTGMAGGGAGAMTGGPGGGSSLSDATLAYLVAEQGDATWLVAVSDASTASQIELATGRGVMSMGGFSGSDDALSLEQLQAYVASGELRFVVTGGARGGPSGGTATSEVSSWVSSACTVVTVDGTATSVYDCAGAVAG